jgi:hypothetical protein
MKPLILAVPRRNISNISDPGRTRRLSGAENRRAHKNPTRQYRNRPKRYHAIVAILG